MIGERGNLLLEGLLRSPYSKTSFSYCKDSTDIETEVNATIQPITGRFSDETFFNHGGAIGEVELENVATCLDIEADT